MVLLSAAGRIRVISLWDSCICVCTIMRYQNVNTLSGILKYWVYIGCHEERSSFVFRKRNILVLRRKVNWMMMATASTAYSGVTRRPALSARLCCHDASRLPPPHTRSLLTLPLSFHHSASFSVSRILHVTAHATENHPPPITQTCQEVSSCRKGHHFAERALTRDWPSQVSWGGAESPDYH